MSATRLTLLALLPLLGTAIAGCLDGPGVTAPSAGRVTAPPVSTRQATAVSTDEASSTRLSATPTPTALTTTTPVDPSQVEITIELVAAGFASPVHVTVAGDGSGRMYVVEQAGAVRTVTDGTVDPLPFLDIRDRVNDGALEQGLLGLAFHPRFARNGRLFVNYTAEDDSTIVSELGLTADRRAADSASERRLLRIEQPARNHNGGMLAFGPDGTLYIGTGDGGGAGDRYGNAQDPASLLGKILRVDVNDTGVAPYAIPADNPFVGHPAFRGEVWALGLRNPWRFSFDGLTGDLFVGDVGQASWEEVNWQPAVRAAGVNYGWPVLEGSHCFGDAEGCDPLSLSSRPIAEYDHDRGCAVVGGYVYRGRRQPGLNGLYVFGDQCTGRIWVAAPKADGSWAWAEAADTELSISSFGLDAFGELYVVDEDGGGLYRVVQR